MKKYDLVSILRPTTEDNSVEEIHKNITEIITSNGGKRRRWEFAIKKTEKIETILSDKYIWNFLKPWLKKQEARMERVMILEFLLLTKIHKKLVKIAVILLEMVLEEENPLRLADQ